MPLDITLSSRVLQYQKTHYRFVYYIKSNMYQQLTVKCECLGKGIIRYKGCRAFFLLDQPGEGIRAERRELNLHVKKLMFYENLKIYT